MFWSLRRQAVTGAGDRMAHEALQRQTEVQGSSDRAFGLVFGAVFLLIALWPLLATRPPRWWAVAASAAFLLVAWLAPTLLRPLNRLWLRLGLLLHQITSPVILGILFFVFFAPMGLVMRLFGKDLLRLRIDKQASSYWIERQPPGPPPESLSKQF